MRTTAASSFSQPADAARPPASPASRLRDLLVAFVPVQAAFLWLYYYPRPKVLMGDEMRYFADGLRIAQGEPAEPTFVWPPAQAFLLGASFRLFGTTLIPVQVLQVLLLLGGAFLLRGIARRVGLSAAASDLCLVSYACMPELVAHSHYLWPEVSHLFFALLAASLVSRARPAPMAAAGASLGVALLLKSILVPFVPLFLAAAAWPPAGSRRPRAVPALLLAAGLLATTMPVVVGNGLRHGYWGIASSAGFNVSVGLDDASRRNLVGEIVALRMEEYLASSRDPREREQLAWTAASRKVREEGLAAVLAAQLGKQYHRLLDRDSFFTDQLPGGASPTYAGLSMGANWQLRVISYILYGLVLVTSAMGLCLPLPADQRRRMAPFTAYLAGSLFLFLFLHVKTRYRVAFYPVLFLHAGAAWDALAGSLPGWTPARAACGAALSAFLLWLAFSPK